MKLTIDVTPQQKKEIEDYINPNKKNGKHIPGYVWGVIADFLLQWANNIALLYDLELHLKENGIAQVNIHSGWNNIHRTCGESVGPYLQTYQDQRLDDGSGAPWVVRLLVDPRLEEAPRDRDFQELRLRYQQIKALINENKAA